MVCESFVGNSRANKCREKVLYRVESFPGFGANVCIYHLSVVMQKAKRVMGKTQFKVTIL